MDNVFFEHITAFFHRNNANVNFILDLCSPTDKIVMLVDKVYGVM